MSRVRVRPAVGSDAEVVHGFICDLAAYEEEPDAVEATPASLRAQLVAETPPFGCLIAELDGVAVGFALFFQTYSTWKGVPGMWLEDLWVASSARKRGVARALFAALGAVCRERGYARLDFAVLDWNELAHAFYRSVGAEPMKEWTTHRVSGRALDEL